MGLDRLEQRPMGAAVCIGTEYCEAEFRQLTRAGRRGRREPTGHLKRPPFFPYCQKMFRAKTLQAYVYCKLPMVFSIFCAIQPGDESDCGSPAGI